MKNFVLVVIMTFSGLAFSQKDGFSIMSESMATFKVLDIQEMTEVTTGTKEFNVHIFSFKDSIFTHITNRGGEMMTQIYKITDVTYKKDLYFITLISSNTGYQYYYFIDNRDGKLFMYQLITFLENSYSGIKYGRIVEMGFGGYEK